MSRFRKLSHVVWHCQYHIVWVPKYRYRVLKDRVGFEVSKTVWRQLSCPVRRQLSWPVLVKKMGYFFKLCFLR